MTSSRPERLDVRHLTSNQPFCAGVILLRDGGLVVTLNTDGLPSNLDKGHAWRVGGVGGGQEAGETLWECAEREAREELLTSVQLVSSSMTYFHDIDTGELYSLSCIDTIAPFLLERQSNLFPYTPYRPGLPTGPYTYFGLFFAQVEQAKIQPGDDVEGLLILPLNLWPALLKQPTLEMLLQQGAQVIEHETLPRERKLWVHPHESFGIVATLLAKHPELLRGF